MASPTDPKPLYEPTPDEIAAVCAECRAAWSPGDCAYRLENGVNQSVALLASILRPMAVDAGYLPKAAAQDEARATIAPDRDPNIVPPADASERMQRASPRVRSSRR